MSFYPLWELWVFFNFPRGLSDQFMPGDFYHNRGDFSRFVYEIVYRSNGIFGTPIYASAQFVFIFILFGAILESTGAGKMFIDLAIRGAAAFIMVELECAQHHRRLCDGRHTDRCHHDKRPVHEVHTHRNRVFRYDRRLAAEFHDYR